MANNSDRPIAHYSLHTYRHPLQVTYAYLYWICRQAQT